MKPGCEEHIFEKPMFLNASLTMMKLSTLLLLPALCSAFVAPHARPQTRLFSTIDANLVPPTSEELNDLKTKLVSLCNRDPKASIQEVRDAVDEVESLGEQVCPNISMCALNSIIKVSKLKFFHPPVGYRSGILI